MGFFCENIVNPNKKIREARFLEETSRSYLEDQENRTFFETKKILTTFPEFGRIFFGHPDPQNHEYLQKHAQEPKIITCCQCECFRASPCGHFPHEQYCEIPPSCGSAKYGYPKIRPQITENGHVGTIR